jgi:hypothetical protein
MKGALEARHGWGKKGKKEGETSTEKIGRTANKPKKTRKESKKQ